MPETARGTSIIIYRDRYKVGDEDGAGNRALREEAYQAKVDFNIIQGIVQYVEQREVSRSLDESKVDIGVSDALKLLVIVTFSHRSCRST